MGSGGVEAPCGEPTGIVDASVRSPHGGMGNGPRAGPVARPEETGSVAAKGGRGEDVLPHLT